MTNSDRTPATLPDGLPLPPVPKGLREMLKDYPEHLQVLQNDLNDVVAKPLRGTPVFEQAIWALEGALETFVSEARDELEAAEASGDAETIQRARAKRQAFGSARADMGLLSELRAYFSDRGR
ncbi:hypothetical protein [Lysobacter enzymogenes]|nr:hypothetical protein [Lysobacter enzymogenes]